MMIGTRIAFWMHLGCLGGHLGAQKMGRGIPSRERLTGPTLPGRGRGGVNPSLEGTGRIGLLDPLLVSLIRDKKGYII